MKIDLLKNIIQSAHLNFLFGSGLSRPYLSTLGEIEIWLTDVASNTDLNEKERTILECSIIYEYLKGVIYPNLPEIIEKDDSLGLYKQTTDNYACILQHLGTILSNRHMNLCNRSANIFTTNIDMLIEKATTKASLEFNDGFVGRNPAVFNEGSFSKQSTKVSAILQKSHELATVNYVKLHGSINWSFEDTIIADDDLINVKKTKQAFSKLPYKLDINQIKQSYLESCEADKTPAPSAKDILDRIIDLLKIDVFIGSCDVDMSLYYEALESYHKILMVNPRKSKFRETVMDLPFYELMRLYSNSLERPNSILFVAGFSFADEHMRMITKRAANSNPTLQIIVFAYSDKEQESLEKILNIEGDCNNNNIIILSPGLYKTNNSNINQKESRISIENIEDLTYFDLKSIDRFVFEPIVNSIRHNNYD